MGESRDMLRVVLCLCLLLGLCIAYPPAPWTQKGKAFVAEIEVDVQVARKVAPDTFAIVETKPGSGKTLGSLFIAQYDNSSTVAYHEMFFIIGTVKYTVGGQSGSWIAKAYVDNNDALDAGIQEWGVTKEMATFDWTVDGEPNNINVTVGGEPLIHVSYTDTRLKVPLPSANVKSFGILKQQVLFSATKQTYHVGMPKQVTIDVGSEILPFWPSQSSAVTTKITKDL